MVLIGFQWVRGKALLTPASNAPTIGVISNRTNPIGEALRTDEQFQRTRRERKDKQNTPWWPAFVNVFPEAPFPEQADGYRRQLLDALRSVWDAYAPVIDNVVGKRELAS